MNTHSFPNGRRQALAASALFLATFTSAEIHAQVTNLDGDHRVISQGAELGNLDADGYLGWGRTGGSPDGVAAKLRYFPGDTELSFDAAKTNAVFTWNDNATDLTGRIKMKLDANNVLSLYKTDGVTESISLTPQTGALKLSGAGAGLFNSSGGGVLQIDGSGRPYFASKPIFQDGVDFGSGGTLNSAKVEYLQGVLSTLGYDPNEAAYTDVTNIPLFPGMSLQKAIYANGSIYWAGYLSSDAQIGGTTYYVSNGRHVVVKANPAGTVSWVKQIVMQGSFLTPNAIAVNASGTVVVGGNLFGATTSLGAQNMTSTGGTDGFVLVLNSSGVPQWSKVLTSSGAVSDEVYALAIDSSGGVVATGQTAGATMNLGTGSLTSGGGFSDGFVVKYNSSGTAAWSMLAGGSSQDSIRYVAISPSSEVILGGAGGTTTNLGAHNITTAGGSDAWVAAVSAAGTLQWIKTVGGTGSDEARGVTVNSSGNIYLLASFVGTTTTLGAYNKTAAGSNDGLVTALNSSGTVQWATAIGGSASDSPSHIVTDSTGAILVSGTIGGTTTNLGAYNITSKGGNDGFTLVLNSSGTPTASQGIGSAGGDSLSGAFPMGALSSGMVLTGSVAVNTSVGDTRIPYGSFIISTAQSSLVTRPAATVAGLDWNGGLATGAEGVAIGSEAFSQGLGAVAMGKSSASGAWSFATGGGRAAGDFSTAIGSETTATGTYSTAMGQYSWATGSHSFAVGHGANATGSGAMALGNATQALAESSFAAGSSSTANSPNSIAMGELSVANGAGAVAIGGFNTANGEYSTALGGGTTTNGLCSFAAGFLTFADSYASTALGNSNIGGGDANVWVDTDPLVEVGNSQSFTRSNALTVLKNGRSTLTNRAWKAAVALDPEDALEDPEDENDSGGDALVVEGHTRLKGKVLIEPQGDLSMGEFTGGEAP